MIKKNIKLVTIEDVKEFVNATASIDCDIDLKTGRYVVDARSIIGIFTLDLSHPVELVIHSNNAEYLVPFAKWFV